MLKKLFVMLEKLEYTEEFKAFKKNNEDSYLVSAFFMVAGDELVNAGWQADFYSPSKHKITSFVLSGDVVEVKGNQQVFQKGRKVLAELDIGKVKVDFKDVMKTIGKLKKDKYPSESPNKIIVLLQNIDGECAWNITYLTNSFNVWNIKVSARDGKVISEKLESIISFRSQ